MIDVLDKERQALDPKLEGLLEDAVEDPRGYVYCAACAHVVARRSDRIEVNGGHAHFFTNPVGIRFHVGCVATRSYRRPASSVRRILPPACARRRRTRRWATNGTGTAKGPRLGPMR